MIFRHSLPVNNGDVVVRQFIVLLVLYNGTIGRNITVCKEPYAEPRILISLTSLSREIRAEIERLPFVNGDWIEAELSLHLIAALVDPEVI